MHKAIFDLVTFGKGGWDHDAVYNLPIHLRNFYIKQLSEVIKAETEAAKGKRSNRRNRKNPSQ